MERSTKFKAYLIIVLTLIFASLFALFMAIFLIVREPSQANGDLQTARSKLENVIENQREEAKLHPEDTTLKRLDFLDIVEKEQKYDQAFVHVVNVESLKAMYIAIAALLSAVAALILAAISFTAPLFKKDESKKVLEGGSMSASQWLAITAVLLSVTSLLVALFKKDESKKVIKGG